MSYLSLVVVGWGPIPHMLFLPLCCLRKSSPVLDNRFPWQQCQCVFPGNSVSVCVPLATVSVCVHLATVSVCVCGGGYDLESLCAVFLMFAAKTF